MAWPIILANITVPLLGAVDTAVVGHLPEPYYIGAVALGAMLFNYIYHLFNCLRMGTTGPTAQARGAGDSAEVRAMITRALLLAGVIGGVIVALQLPIITFAFWKDQAAMLPPVWDEVLRSLILADYIEDPTQRLVDEDLSDFFETT